MILKLMIVVLLEKLCTAIDYIPGWNGRWYWRAQYGCYPLRLASLSAHLEDRWGTDYWKRGDDDEEPPSQGHSSTERESADGEAPVQPDLSEVWGRPGDPL